ncbi:hypothetical protein D3C73_1570910 [compost metagenome]
MNEAIPVIATTMTMGGETSPAEMAACPMTRAPTMLTADPTCLGRRSPASRRASNMISISKASTKTGKGICSLVLAMVRSRLVGIIS